MRSRQFFILLALSAAIACTKGALSTTTGSTVAEVGAPEFKSKAEQKKGLYLDVRTPGEVARGHLPGATVIDTNDPKFKQKLSVMQKDRPMFVYCASGRRSSAAAAVMNEVGFGEVYNLAGGIAAWTREGFPVEQAQVPSSAGAHAMQPAAFDALLQTDKRVLVDFQTPWCTPCQQMSPIVDALTEAWKGKATVLRVDIDESEALATREKIQGVPVFVLYVDGTERWRHSGEVTRDVLEAALSQP